MSPCLPSLRHLSASCGGRGPFRTTIRLERAFWQAIDTLAAQNGVGWAEWAAPHLADKPAGVGRATWLRTMALTEAMQPIRAGARAGNSAAGKRTIQGARP